jgi:hypothetical protein
MPHYASHPRPQGAIPEITLSDDAIVRAQAIARRERSEAFRRAIHWGVGAIRRLAD